MTNFKAEKNFVTEMSDKTTEIEAHLKSQDTRKKMEKDKRDLLIRETKKDTLSSPLEKNLRRETDGYVEDKRQQQQMLDVKQDIVLDDINEALARLGDVANTINKELVDSERLIGEVTEDTEEAENNMQKALRQMDRVLGKSDKGKYCCIVILVVVAIVLFIALVY